MSAEAIKAMQTILNLMNCEQRRDVFRQMFRDDRSSSSPFDAGSSTASEASDAGRHYRVRKLAFQSPLSSDSASVSSFASGSSTTSSSGSPKRRKRGQTRHDKLAKYIFSQYMAAPNVINHVYNAEKNRVCDIKLNQVLDQIVTALSADRRDLFKANRNLVISSLKKKLSAGRSYRRKRRKVGCALPDAPFSRTIDLTADTDNDSDKEPTNSSDSTTDSKDDNNDSHSDNEMSHSDLAKQFVKKLNKRRESRQTKTNSIKSKKSSNKTQTPPTTTTTTTPVTTTTDDSFLKKGSTCEVRYDGTWYAAQIVCKHRGRGSGYKVYFICDKTTACHVQVRDIRAPQ